MLGELFIVDRIELLLQPPSASQLGSPSKLPKNIPSIAHELPSQAHLLFKFRIMGCDAKTISGFGQQDRIPLGHLQTGKRFFSTYPFEFCTFLAEYFSTYARLPLFMGP